MATLEKNIQGADAFILMYSVTDKCSFDDCNRLKFLINYNKRRRKLGSNSKASKLADFDIDFYFVCAFFIKILIPSNTPYLY